MEGQGEDGDQLAAVAGGEDAREYHGKDAGHDAAKGGRQELGWGGVELWEMERVVFEPTTTSSGFQSLATPVSWNSAMPMPVR